jgi:hypothetical protein
MGPPVKVLIEGQPVFLCCGSCEEKAKANPGKTLQTVEKLRKRKAAPPPPPPAPGPASASEEENDVRAGLGKLDAGDRKLAEAQRWCALESDNRLGSMGKPVKVTIQGQAVFLCCKGCQDSALAAPEKTLARVRELKAKAKAESSKRPHTHSPEGGRP